MSELVTPDCFPGLPLIEQLRSILAALGSDACIWNKTDFYRAWLELLDPEACAEPSQDALQGAVYARLYDNAGDGTIVSPACFYGLSSEEKELAIFEALTAVSGGGGDDSGLFFGDAGDLFFVGSGGSPFFN